MSVNLLIIGQAREDYENAAERKVYTIIISEDGKVKHVIKQGVLRAYSDVVLFYRKIKLMSIVNSYFEFINLGT